MGSFEQGQGRDQSGISGRPVHMRCPGPGVTEEHSIVNVAENTPVTLWLDAWLFLFFKRKEEKEKGLCVGSP